MVETDIARTEEVRKSIQHVLKDINKPSMSLEELRARVDEEMGDMRLSDFIVRQRDDRD